MKKMTYRVFPVLLAVPFALFSVACSGGDETITAENVTVEECNDLFGPSDAETSGEDMLEGDYDADGDVDEDDAAIEERCEELMAEDDSTQG